MRSLGENELEERSLNLEKQSFRRAKRGRNLLSLETHANRGDMRSASLFIQKNAAFSMDAAFLLWYDGNNSNRGAALFFHRRIGSLRDRT